MKNKPLADASSYDPYDESDEFSKDVGETFEEWSEFLQTEDPDDLSERSVPNIDDL